MRKRYFRKRTFIDDNGYERKHSSLIHRQNAYKYIYKPNKDKYPYPFSAYQVHHIDGNKNHNHSSNLKIVLKEEHEEIHGISGRNGKNNKIHMIDSDYKEGVIPSEVFGVIMLFGGFIIGAFNKVLGIILIFSGIFVIISSIKKSRKRILRIRGKI